MRVNDPFSLQGIEDLREVEWLKAGSLVVQYRPSGGFYADVPGQRTLFTVTKVTKARVTVMMIRKSPGDPVVRQWYLPKYGNALEEVGTSNHSYTSTYLYPPEHESVKQDERREAERNLRSPLKAAVDEFSDKVRWADAKSARDLANLLNKFADDLDDLDQE